METRTYYAEDLPAALEQIKSELGEDAIIVKSRKIKRKTGPLGLFRKEMYEVIVSSDTPAPPIGKKHTGVPAREALRKSPSYVPPKPRQGRQTEAERQAASVEMEDIQVQPERFAQLVRMSSSRLNELEEQELLEALSSGDAAEQPMATTHASMVSAYSATRQQPRRQQPAAPVQEQPAVQPVPEQPQAAPVQVVRPAVFPQYTVQEAQPGATVQPAAAVQPVEQPAAVGQPVGQPIGQPIGQPAAEAQPAEQPAATVQQAQELQPAAGGQGVQPVVKRGRGRPRKNPLPAEQAPAAAPTQPKDETMDRLDALERMMGKLTVLLGGAVGAASTPQGAKNPELEAILERLKEQDVDSSALAALEEDVAQYMAAHPNADCKSAMKRAIKNMLGKPRCLRAGRQKPRCIMMIGPTGVGKTTTLVKLVAHCVFERGAKAAIINADVFRVGAQDQMSVYADILNVPVATIYDYGDIAEAIEELSDAEFIFIDTSGKAPQDQEYQRTLRQLIASEKIHELYLTISSTTSSRVCRQIVRDYSGIGEFRLLVTKVDESGSYGALLNLSHESGMPVSYMTVGQSVPDDIQRVDVDVLADMLVG